jgi:Peptidase M76 family
LLQSLFADHSTTSTGTAANKTSNSNRDALQWRDTTQGVQVLIPTEAASRRHGIPMAAAPPHRRRWSRLATEKEAQAIIEKDEAEEDDDHHNSDMSAREKTVEAASQSLVLQATSASAATRTAASIPPSYSLTHEPETEWLQVSCKTCSDTGPEAGARAYIMGPTPLSMVVCTNRLLSSPSDYENSGSEKLPSSSSSLLFSKTAASKLTTLSSEQEQSHQKQQRRKEEQLREMEEILTHELVHVYDVRKLQLDLRDCENLAYSEVRAAREAECQRLGASLSVASSSSASASSASGGSGGLWRHSSYNPHEACVRTKALTATHNLFPSHGQACLQRVFDKAMKDKRPFAGK